MLPQWILAVAMSLAPKPQTATIVFAGDAMQHQKQLEVARTSHGYDYRQCFEGITDWVSSADYAVVNLETPLGHNDFSGFPCFNAPVEYAEALRDAGFDMMLTANNHTLDRRDRGLKRTVAILDSIGVDHIGTYPDSKAREAAIPAIHDIKGFKVGFLNYTYGTNGIDIQGDVVVDMLDKEQIRRDVQATRAAGAEIVVVAVHWGIEYVLTAPEPVRRMADYLCSLDVDMVIGGHPHVIQPMEVRQNKTTGRPVLLVYSMGNLISNMRTRPTRGGAMVRTVIRRDDNGRAYFDSAEYMPHFTVPGTSVSDNFRVVFLPADADVDKVIPASARPLAKAWLQTVMPVFDRYNVDVPRAQTAR